MQLHLPGGVEAVGGLLGKPGREGFVEPDLVPRRRRDEVSEPLVGNFMRNDFEHVALRFGAAARRIEQQVVFGVGDQAPVFHRTPARAGHGKLVERGKVYGWPKYSREEGHHLAAHVEGVAGLFAFARCGEDAKRHTRSAPFQHIELPTATATR